MGYSLLRVPMLPPPLPLKPVGPACVRANSSMIRNSSVPLRPMQWLGSLALALHATMCRRSRGWRGARVSKNRSRRLLVCAWAWTNEFARRQVFRYRPTQTQQPSNEPELQFRKDHKAVNRGTFGGLGQANSADSLTWLDESM